MTVSWDNLTPIDENNKSSVSWDNLTPAEEENQYQRPAGDKGWEISATPKKNLVDKIGQVLKSVVQTPIRAYSQGKKDVEAVELNAKEIFKPLTSTEKARMNQLESAQHPNFGVHGVKYADENITNLPERVSDSIKKGYGETFENLTNSVEVMKAGGIGSAVVGGVGALGGALWGIRKGNPVEGALDGFKVGARLGGGAGAFQKSFELEAGSARQELKNFKDKDGKPLPNELINRASLAVGVANASLELVGLDAELKTFPGMDKIFKQSKKDLIKEIATNPTLREKLLAAGGQLVKSTAVESSTEMIQQCSNILADEWANNKLGNHDATVFEDGKINQGALRSHIGEIIQAGVSAIGPSLIMGGVGTTATAINILRENGMAEKQAKKLADSLSVDEKADLINNNLDTLDKVAEKHITDIEAQDIEKNFFDKAIEAHKDTDGNISAEKENQVFSAAKLAGAFAKKFGSNKEQTQAWFNKLAFQNKPLEGSVSMDVPFEELTSENVPEVMFQKKIDKPLKSFGYDDKVYFTDDNTFELPEEQKGVLKNYRKQVNAFLKDTTKNRGALELGKTPQALQEAGLEDLPMETHTNIVNKVMYDKHSVKESTVRNLPKLLANPVAVFKSKTKGNSIIALTSDLDKNGKPVLVAIDKNNTKKGYNVNFVSSAYGKNEQWFKNLVKDGHLLKLNKKNIPSWLQVDDNPSSSVGVNSSLATITQGQDNNIINGNGENFNPTYYQKNIENSFGSKPEEIEGMLSSDIEGVLADSNVDDSEFKFEGAKIYGSYLKGTNTKTSDLDLLVQYSGSMREDVAFNMFADAKLKLQNALGKDIKVDINPINTEKSGTIEDHLQHLDKIEGDVNTYYQAKKPTERDYLGYFQEGQDKNIIGIMQDANPSTLVHEMGHLFLQGLNEFAKSDAEAKKTLKEVNDWLGYSDGAYEVNQKMMGNRDVRSDYTDEQHEKFAQGFTAYLYNGKAPSSVLREVFENFKEWLRSIYTHVDELGVKLTPEIKDIFDSIFSDKAEKTQEVSDLVNKVNNISMSDKLTEYQKRHKETAYDILAYGLGKNKQWLKTILESDSDSPKIVKNREKIQEAVGNINDPYSSGDGMLPEWREFFGNHNVNYDNQEVGGDYELASAAFDTIVNQTYKTDISEYAFLDATEAQYQYLLDQYKKSADRDVPLAAFWQWLDKVEPDFIEIYADKYEKDVAYIERFEKMDKFEQAKEIILKGFKEANSPNALERYRELVKTTMNNLKFLTPRDKAKLTNNILSYETDYALERQIDELLDVAKTMDDVNYKMKMMQQVHEELQGTKNVKQSNKTVGKYDYSTNKIFERLRELDALTQEQAYELYLLPDETNEEKGLSFEDKIVKSFTAYKANGIAYSSTEVVKSMYDDIVKMKIAGKESKSDLEFEKKLDYSKEVVELVRVLDKKNVANFATKGYLRIVSNWESMLNAVFNKHIMDKYSLLKPQRESDDWIYRQKQNFKEKVAEIYGKKLWDFDHAIIENIKTKYTFFENVEDVENVGQDRQIPKEMNKMEVLLAWIWDNNEVLHERLVNQFGNMQLLEMFSNLSTEDKQLGNLMMHTVNSFYPQANEAFIKKYGIDLPRVEHYFPSKVERISEIDLLTDFASKSTDPTFIKRRSGGVNLVMDFDNPVNMLFGHIESMGKFIHMTETLDRQNKIFKAKLVRDLIGVKYGEDTYKELLKMFINNSYRQDSVIRSWYGKVMNDVVSNFLISNVAIKPSIGIKQLISSSNYASEMPFSKWATGYVKALTKPNETIEYMKKIPYLEARFESGGQNEFLKNVIHNSAFAKTKKWKEYATLNLRMGDIGAIAFGGKPYLEYLMNDKKMSEQAAIDEFLNHTQRTMQASETSTLNNFQMEMSKNPFGQLLTAYQNAQWQYARMAGDSVVSYANGDITMDKMAKNLFMYMFLNPLLYRTATSLSLITLATTGKADDLKDDIVGSIFDFNASCIALIGPIIETLVTLAQGKKVYGDKVPLIGDILEHITKISKEDVTLQDYLEFLGYGIQVGTGVPINAVGNSLSGVGDVAQGKVLKGGLKVLGWSEGRAAHAAGEEKVKHKKHKHKLNL